MAAAWEAALADATAELNSLTAEELEDAISDAGVSEKIVWRLLENMPGRCVPFEDRFSITGAWRRVMVVAQEGEEVAELRLVSGEIADEPPDTPGGRLPLRDGNNSLKSEYGLFYRLPLRLRDLEVEVLNVFTYHGTEGCVKHQ